MLTKCKTCGWAHPVEAPHIRLEKEGATPSSVRSAGEPAVPVPEEVTAILQDYERLAARDAEKRAIKAAQMRRYRARKREEAR